MSQRKKRLTYQQQLLYVQMAMIILILNRFELKDWFLIEDLPEQGTLTSPVLQHKAATESDIDCPF